MSKKLEVLKLIEITSKTQAKNGTQCFHDPIANCDYLSYKSGYIRRRYIATCYRWRGDKKFTTIYQLNPTQKVNEWSDWAGRDIRCTKRILIHNPKYRLYLIANAVANYRKYLKK